jgi:hypothetical protein
MDDKVLQIILKARDEASATLSAVGKEAGGVADLLNKSFKNAAIVSGVALGGLVLAAKSSIDAFKETELVAAQTDAVLKSTASSRIGVNQQVMVSTKSVANATKDYGDKVKTAEAKLKDMEERMKSVKEPTESAKLALEKQRAEVDKLHGSATKLVGVYKTELHPEMQISAEMVSGLAAQFQHLTGISDDTVQSGENILLTFTNIGKNIFPQATESILDMSTALGTDVTGSAIQLGKALNDPIIGVTALRRVGVQFNDTQQTTIEKLAKSGHLLDAQKMILQELQIEFGGSARAAGQTFAGQMKILDGAVNDVQKSIGKTLTTALLPFAKNMTEIVFPISQAANGTISWAKAEKQMSDNAGLLGKSVAGVIDFIRQHNEVVPIAAGMLGGVLSLSLIAAGVAMAGFIGLSLPVLTIAAGIGAVAVLIAQNWGTIGPVIMPIVEQIKGFFLAIADGITNFVTVNMPTFQAVWAVLTNLLDYGLKFMSGLWNAVWPAMMVTFKGIWEMITGVFKVLWGAFQVILSVGLVLMTGNWNNAWNLMKTGFMGIFDGIKTFAKGWWDSIVGMFKTGLNTIVGTLNGFIRVINKAGSGVGVNIPNIPSFDNGGFVNSTGLAMVHQGEFVLSNDMLKGNASIPGRVTNNMSQPITIEAIFNTPADLDSFGYQLAWQLRNQ